MVKGVDLRSTAGNCVWVRTPQLTESKLAPEIYMLEAGTNAVANGSKKLSLPATVHFVWSASCLPQFVMHGVKPPEQQRVQRLGQGLRTRRRLFACNLNNMTSGSSPEVSLPEWLRGWT